jgi:hypothetical protein
MDLKAVGDAAAGLAGRRDRDATGGREAEDGATGAS